MKKWIAMILMLFLLAGCAKETVPINRPHALEVEYGESAVHAMTGGYQWVWREGRKTASAMTDAANPRSMMDKISYLNAGKATELKLNFAVEPNKLLVKSYSNVDSYAGATELTVTDYTLEAPLDGGDHLYEVTAVWTEARDVDCWGSCTYLFRFLSNGVSTSTGNQMPEYGNLDLYQLVQLDDTALLGVEFLNNVEGTSKTCRNQADKAAILEFLRNNLATDFQPISVAAPQVDYMLRIVCVDGTQMSLGYGTDGLQSWLMIGGSPYAAETMDLSTLWNSLTAGSVHQDLANTGRHYLNTTEALPDADWGTDYVYGYIGQLDAAAVTYDEIRWIEDSADPNGYHLEPGWKGQSKTVAADCVLWLFDEDISVYGQVSNAEQLLEWAGNGAETETLFRFYTKDNQIIAICEQYQP